MYITLERHREWGSVAALLRLNFHPHYVFFIPKDTTRSCRGKGRIDIVCTLFFILFFILLFCSHSSFLSCLFHWFLLCLLCHPLLSHSLFLRYQLSDFTYSYISYFCFYSFYIFLATIWCLIFLISILPVTVKFILITVLFFFCFFWYWLYISKSAQES